ncbi:MAG: hypothetical protein QOH52_2762 [Pseudonocardiales bacterium]|nr:hypothetical protein [Jatrophihabitans sp.]MDT4904746.1 hypothetical protein [Pseudonocardiales bacterium]
MDSEPNQPPVVKFVADRRFTGLAAAGVVVAVVIAVLANDRAGQLLAGLAALVLALYVVSDLVFSPRLVVSAQGLRVRSPFTRADLPWSQVEDVRADTRTRLGLRSTTLEIDAGPVLAVMSRRALGADPEDVAELVNAFRPH